VLADADVPGAAAVPVEQYQVDDRILTLLVAHDITCTVALVLLVPDDGGADVLVVYTPTRYTRTTAPGYLYSTETPDVASSGAPSTVCQPAPGVLTVRSTTDVVLPRDMPIAFVRDVGAHGAALAAAPTPSH
jgi:hypothetical protein